MTSAWERKSGTERFECVMLVVTNVKGFMLLFSYVAEHLNICADFDA